MAKLRQNDISSLRQSGMDLNPRLEEILGDISNKSGFQPDLESIRTIQWWKGGKVGSASIFGVLDANQAVLKIQGSKPNTSEYQMIYEFSKQNKSKIIRPPKVYQFFEWDEDLQYEGLIYEKANENFPIKKRPLNQNEIELYLGLYCEYRRNCRVDPWIKRPDSIDFKTRVKDWMVAVKHMSAKDKLGHRSDGGLMTEALRILETEIGLSDLEFCHGHFQTGDLHIVTKDEIILTSNLFWSWRNPFYDAAFGYHWWMLGMEHMPNLDDEALENERQKWLNRLFSLDEVISRKDGERLLNLALLERAIPALMVDRFMTDQSKLSAKIITDGARRELTRLVNVFK